jgi:tetratricopeptide (TPR) repeat protein
VTYTALIWKSAAQQAILRHMKRILILIALIVTLPAPRLSAYEDASQKLASAAALEQSNDPAQAIRSVRVLLDSNRLTGLELVQAWNILGLAYSDQEDFTSARQAYEKALSLMDVNSGDASVRSRYANVLSNFADMYSQMNQFEAATHLRLNALHIYQTSEDEAGITKCYANLAGIELSQKHVRQAAKYMKMAYTALVVANNMDSDDRATV